MNKFKCDCLVGVNKHKNIIIENNDNFFTFYIENKSFFKKEHFEKKDIESLSYSRSCQLVDIDILLISHRISICVAGKTSVFYPYSFNDKETAFSFYKFIFNNLNLESFNLIINKEN